MQTSHCHGPKPDAWASRINTFWREATAVVIGVFDLDGNLVEANEGMQHFLILGEKAISDGRAFMNPTFESLRACADADAPIFSGHLTVGNHFDISRSALVKAYKAGGRILILGEIEVGDLHQRVAEISALNQEANNLRREAQKEKARLEAISAARKRTEARLRQAREIETLGTFAGGMAHYLNNALTPIAFCTELLAERFPETDNGHKLIELILKGVQNSAGIVRQVLEFSQKLSSTTATVDSATAVAKTFEHLRGRISPEISIDVKIDAIAGRIQADADTVTLILDHLVSNAVDSIGEGTGSVTVELGRYEPKSGQDDRFLPIPHIRLAVADTGCGMDDQTRMRALDPFFTTKEVGKGAGLGLSVVYGIVRNVGGTVQISSDVGQGTIVEVFFPVLSETTTTDAEDQVPR
ncbi:MAG: HAMP domain-containing sensor histidine kinase [Rhodospirillales bacterium]|jgi:signal transduction histidine kinase|nr:HAMP domain-containing sensor histidine kinase [Rhodospirillales bacterium]